MGTIPDEIERAALAVQALGPDVIDINMGCPAKSVSARGAGVGLMRTPLKVARLVRRLTSVLERARSLPRSASAGTNARTYTLIARIVEENGGSLIAIHARTKEQSYAGCADWDAIAEVKASVGIPVIGNGDVKTVADIARMREYTGCDAVMIGRAAIANPWIFAGLDRDQVTRRAGSRLGCRAPGSQYPVLWTGRRPRLFRKHAVQYLLLRRLGREDRREILRRRPPAEFLELLSHVHATV